MKLATLTTGSVALAEEVVQDAFIQLHRNWEGVDQPSAWLLPANTNVGLAHIEARTDDSTWLSNINFSGD